jgi:predicted ferric reductase
MRPRHYHGNFVRWLFILNSVVLLITFPIFKTEAIMPIFFGTILVIILIILSALTTSEFKWVHVINVVISLIGVATFEILAFATSTSEDIVIFMIRQGIALSFLLALYFSARSTLGMFAPTSEVTKNTSVSETEKENEELIAEIKNRNDRRVEL